MRAKLYRCGRLLTALVLGVLLVACGEKKPVVSESFVFGTRVEIQVAGDLPVVNRHDEEAIAVGRPIAQRHAGALREPVSDAARHRLVAKRRRDPAAATYWIDRRPPGPAPQPPLPSQPGLPP